MDSLDKVTGDNTLEAKTRDELKRCLAGKIKWAGRELCVYEVTDSTNIQAKHLGDAGNPHGTLVVADRQTAGRGRRGRKWESPQGDNIYMSLLLRPEFAPDKASMLTLVMAYSVQKAIHTCTGLDVQIKWPNDIVIHGKKLVGILTEMSTEIDHINYVVVGVGINVNMEAFPAEIAEKATSLLVECGQDVERSALIGEILKQFERDYEKFLKTEDLSWLRENYNACLVNCGREVMIHGAEMPYRAIALGVNDVGELLVRRENGTEEAIYSGEVSVRGIYGYV